MKSLFHLLLIISLVAPTFTRGADALKKRDEPNRGGSVDLSSQDPKVAAERFKLQSGYAINLFASEKEFPELANPVAMTFDSQGRLWIATMPSYPQYNPPTKPNDKIIILEDTNGDGKADKASVFAEGLHLPTGLELGNGGLYVASQPNLQFLQDTDGDGKADYREIILHGLGSEDSHHAVHAFYWGPDGGLYFHEGTFHASQVETPYGPLRLSNSGAFRFYPRTWRTDVFVSFPFANPWGHVFDRWGQNFIADASGGQNYYGSAMSGRVIYPDKHVRQKEFIQFSVRPTAGCVFVSSRHFPPEAQGNFLFNNDIGFQGIKQYKVFEEGSGFTGEMIEDLLDSSDPNFRPVAIRFAPDGSLFLIDWFNPLIGHMQYSLRDERRDHSHGRVWRITYPGRPLVSAPKIAGATIPELLDNLKLYEDEARYRTRRELNQRNRDEVTEALETWILTLKKPLEDTNYWHNLLEAFWVYQTLNIKDEGSLEATVFQLLLRANEPRARAAATRALRFWLDRYPVEKSLAMLKEQIADDFPRVRLEALLTLSFFGPANYESTPPPFLSKDAVSNPGSPEAGVAAAEIALQALNQDRDYYIDYVLGETMRTLGPSWKPAIASGKPFAADNPKGLEYALNNISVTELAGAARSRPVYYALLNRDGVDAKFRREALMGVAKLNGTSELKELEAALSRATGFALADLAHLLARWDAKELSGVRDLVERLATKEKDSGVRQAGFAAMMRADGSLASAWGLAEKSPRTLTDLLDATELLAGARLSPAAAVSRSPSVAASENRLEAKLLAEFYPKTKPLLTGLPASLAAQSGKAADVRYIRIELPGEMRILTLAEVQVFAGGKNIALTGKASQSGTAYNARAERAIDGRTDGDFSAGTSTHTPENQPNPWWELDLGSEQFVDQVTIWNRTDSGLAKRLDGLRLVALDKDRRAVFKSENNPAPSPSATIELSGDPFPAVRRSAIAALGRIPGHDAETYAALSGLIVKDIDPDAVIASLTLLKRDAWPRDNFERVAQAVTAHAAKVPVAQRDTPEFAAMLDLGRFVAKGLPASVAEILLAKLRSIEVQRFVIKAVESQMRFDVSQFYVEADRPVEIVFENPDEMQHNFVVVAPGAKEEIGMAADRMGGSGFAKNFIPTSPKVLHATKLVSPKGGVERLRFLPPKAPADYPYLCSFPGHWLTMSGVMTVVQTGDAKAGEIVYGRKEGEKLPPIAELLAVRGNAEAGKVVFARACIVCHKIGDAGVNFAPNLSQIGSRLTREQIIKSILEPSAEIAKGNESVNVETSDGELYTGLIDEETAGQLKLRIGAGLVQTIPKSSVKMREISKNSGMPVGLEQTMSKQEFVDLVEYLAAQK